METIKNFISSNYQSIPVVLVFDKHKPGSAKEHERMRRGENSTDDYDLTLLGSLPKRDAVLKNTHNKSGLTRVLKAFSYGEYVDTDDEAYTHDEADITIISHMLAAVNLGKKVIRIMSDDTDVFILLVYWVFKKKVEAKVQLEKWDGTVLNINETCKKLGILCLLLLAIHALTGCDTVSYTFGKGKARAVTAIMGTAKKPKQWTFQSFILCLESLKRRLLIS